MVEIWKAFNPAGTISTVVRKSRVSVGTGRPSLPHRNWESLELSVTFPLFSGVLMLVDGEVFVDPDVGLVPPLLEQQGRLGTGVAECSDTGTPLPVNP